MDREFETIDVAEAKPGVVLVTLNRPDKGNGVVPQMARDLMAVLNAVDEDFSVRVVVLTGAGKVFSAGADLVALHDYLAHELPVRQEPFNARVLYPVMQKIVASRVPVIAAVNGAATAGGLDLALACDLRVASTRARFGETYVKIGLAPGNGGAWFLPRLVGSGRAAELALTGDLITAAEALEIGLVNRVVEPEELLPAALSIAERIAANPWRAVEATKQALRASWQQDLAGALNFGYWTAGALHWTDDFQGRVAAFVERKTGGDGRERG
ncbi:MAG TPA: enoyl-CoA hydratase/isomerase family protein [Acidimicrobiia bacterium]|nr:enoyl-CoA hydratase/isomerase family protein [Acidimicrobiia bacterium]